MLCLSELHVLCELSLYVELEAPYLVPFHVLHVEAIFALLALLVLLLLAAALLYNAKAAGEDEEGGHHSNGYDSPGRDCNTNTQYGLD